MSAICSYYFTKYLAIKSDRFEIFLFALTPSYVMFGLFRIYNILAVEPNALVTGRCFILGATNLQFK